MKETMVDTRVTYTRNRAAGFSLLKMCQRAGVRRPESEFFAADTVEHVQSIIKGKKAGKSDQTPRVSL